MKFKNYTLQVPDQEYRSIDAFSYSLLKGLDEEGPQVLLDGQNKTGPALEFGSLVDLLITAPETKADKFWTKTLTKPTASLLELADALILDLVVMDGSPRDINHENIQEKIKQLGIWSNIKDQEKLKAKYDDPIFWDYIKESYEAKGKIILSQEILDAAEHCAIVLKTHDFTREFFIERDGIEVLYQVVILYKFKGIQGKAKLDLVRIDHNNKKIYPFDIKTGAKLPSKFQESFYEYKYYLQVISYLIALQFLVETIPDLNGYNIAPFRFLYISKKLPDTPAIYEVPEALLNSFLDGWDNHIGFMELVDNYKYAKENNCYNIERKIIEKQGQLKIELE